MGKLSGKSALITGGGQGIGRGIAMALAKDGASVAIVGRTVEKLEKVVAEIEANSERVLAEKRAKEETARLKAEKEETERISKEKEAARLKAEKEEIENGVDKSQPNYIETLNQRFKVKSYFFINHSINFRRN